MKNLLMILVFFFVKLSFGQANQSYILVDAKMDKISNNLSSTTTGIAKYINANFKSDNDKIRAVFYWTASNIKYDVENMNTIDFNEVSEDKIKNTLISKKGVCIHYAEVFNDIATKIGFKTHIVYGYTKQNGKIGALSHAWCSVEIDGVWWLFDPTWGAGYVEKGKFSKKINNHWYKVVPAQFITSHIPYDYLWQFLNYPVTNQEFIDGKTQIDKTKPYFNFADQIENYDKLSNLEKAKQAVVRIEKNGIKNNLISEIVLYKKKEIAMYQNNAAVDKLNEITADYNNAILLFNDFIYYRNKRFKPVLSDDNIKAMIQNPKEKLLDCQKRIYNIGSVDDANYANVKLFKKSLAEILAQVEEQEKFVNQYLSKNKAGRKAMFSTVKFFGIPVR